VLDEMRGYDELRQVREEAVVSYPEFIWRD
jgi:hypothetical protein